MAYVKQDFIDDRVLSASQLNYIEDGIIANETNINKKSDEIIAYVENTSYTATPENLVEVIASAKKGATIQLTEGTYGKLGLVGTDFYPENLTIVGGEGVIVAGVSITSGVPEEQSYEKSDTDLSRVTLPKGLTFREIEFTNKVMLRNCIIDGLSFVGCTFTNSNLWLDPNRFSDAYGSDGTSVVRPAYMATMLYNVLVRDCVFNNAHDTAIYIRGVNGATIHNNTINGAGCNGIQITYYWDKHWSGGRIAISKNNIYDTGDRGIRIDTLRNADLLILDNTLNRLCQNNPEDFANKEWIKVSGCINTTYQWEYPNGAIYNKYNNEIISVGNGIILDTSAQDSLTNDVVNKVIEALPVYNGEVV